MALYIKYRWWDGCTTELAHRTGFTPSCEHCGVPEPIVTGGFSGSGGGSDSGKTDSETKTECDKESKAIPTKRPYNTYLLNLALDTVIDLPYTYDVVIPRANSSYHGFVQVNGMCRGATSLALLVEATYSRAYEAALEIISNDCLNNEDHSASVGQTVSDTIKGTMHICQFAYLYKVIMDGVVAGAQDAYMSFYGVKYDAQYEESTDYVNLILHAGQIDSDSLSAVFRLGDLAVNEAQNFITADVALLAAMGNAAKKAWYDITKEFFEEQATIIEEMAHYGQQTQQSGNGGSLGGGQRNNQQRARDKKNEEDNKNNKTGNPQIDTWDAEKFDKSNPVDFVDWSGFFADTPTTAGMGTMFMNMASSHINSIIAGITLEYRYRI